MSDDGERDATCADCLEALLVLGHCLTDCRNYFTHYNPYNNQDKLGEMYNRQVKVSIWLSSIFTASRRLNQKRNKLTSAEMQFLTNKSYKAVKDDEENIVFKKNHDYYFSVVGESFITKNEDDSYSQKLYEEGDGEFGDKEKFALSDFGLLYLCCCFLTRQQTQTFVNRAQLFVNSPENMTDGDFDKVVGWSRLYLDAKQKKELAILIKKLRIENYDLKNNENDRLRVLELKNDTNYDRQDTPENAVIKEMLSIYRVRLPKGKRLGKQNNIATVALDMLNELRRCPRELFDLLSPKGQKAFEDKSNSMDGNDDSVSKRIRYSDRFPHLALQAIDEMNMLNNIRFQVRLGYYRFSFYAKNCIDGSDQLRRVGKTLNGFGKLSAMEARRIHDWTPTDNETELQEANKLQRKVYVPTLLEDGKTTLDLLRPVEDHVGNAPYITDSFASYNIHNNRIGLMWETGNTNDVLRFPTLEAVEKGNGRRKPNVNQYAPLCSLSVRDLPALLFLYHLSPGVTAQNVIIQKYEGIKKFLTDLSRASGKDVSEPTVETIIEDVSKNGLEVVLANERYKLKLSDIPERIKESLTSFENGEKDKIDETVTNIETNINIVSYFKELLAGTKYELEGHVSQEQVIAIIRDVGYSNYLQTIPASKMKNITSEMVLRRGLELLAQAGGTSDEKMPQDIRTFIFDCAETDIISEATKETESTNSTLDNTDSEILSVRVKQLLLGKEDKYGNHIPGRLEQRELYIDKLLKEFKIAQDSMFKKDNRYGTKNYKDLRYGRLAELLAKSMIMWQPTNNRGQDKLTSLNYRRLVDFFATYNVSSNVKDDEKGVSEGFSALESVLKKAKLIDSEIPHPFLREALLEKPSNIEELFHVYMEAEKTKLISLKDEMKGFPDDTSLDVLILHAPAFVHPNRGRYKLNPQNRADVRTIAENYIKSGNTLLLPDGLFSDAIIHALECRGLVSIIEDAKEQNQLYNTSFLINRYLEHMDDCCQSYYDASSELFYRGYPLLKKLEEIDKLEYQQYMSRQALFIKLKDKVSFNEAIDKYCAIKHQPEAKENMLRAIGQIKKTEKLILRYKVQDIMLFLTAKKMLQSQQEMRMSNIRNLEHYNRSNLGRLTLAALDRRMELELLRQTQVNDMKLRDVFDGDALNVTMDYEYKKQVTWKKCNEQGFVIMRRRDGSLIPLNERGEPTEKNGTPIVLNREVYITQENVAIKNFGRIFRIINDERLDDLLVLLITKREGRNSQQQVPVYTVSVAELANEFSQLDSKRIDVFEVIHGLEKAAYPNIKNKFSDETFQFKNMMRLICSEQEADAVNQYRVSFAHSKYGVEAQVFGENTHLEVPVVSQIMEEQIHIRSNEIKERLNREQ